MVCKFLGYWEDIMVMIKVFHQISFKELPGVSILQVVALTICVSNYDIEQSISGTASVAGAVGLGDGGGGAGIWPIYLSSYVHFMKAEAAMWLGDATTTRDLMEIGMQHHLRKY